MSELKFDSTKPEEWPRFLRSFGILIDAKGNISDAQKRGLLLAALDDRTLDRLEKWLEPVTLETATYVAIMAILKKKLATTVNTTVKPSPHPDTIGYSTTQKFRNFTSEPMGNKPVTDLAGVGEVLGGRLVALGFDKAYVVLGQFLILKKNKESFQDWMTKACHANSKQSADCFNCLYEWCNEFL